MSLPPVLRRLRVLDFVAVLVSVAAATALALHAGSDRGVGTLVQVDAPEGTWVYPLDQDRLITVTGPVGRNVIQIHDGVARVIDADCRDKICITMGAISRPAAWIACLPNRVFLRVLGTDAETDATAY